MVTSARVAGRHFAFLAGIASDSLFSTCPRPNQLQLIEPGHKRRGLSERQKTAENGSFRFG